MFRHVSVAFVGLGFVACGGTSHTAAPDIPGYVQLNQQLTNDVTTHCQNTAAMSDTSSCASERDRYENQAGAVVEQMTSMSTGMDNCMMAMGRSSVADMHSTCLGMAQEMSNYMNVACASGDLTQDQDTASRHCATMQQMAQGEIDNANSMSQHGGGTSGMMSAGTCQE